MGVSNDSRSESSNRLRFNATEQSRRGDANGQWINQGETNTGAMPVTHRTVK